MLTATTLFDSINRNLTKSLNTVAAEPQVERETAFFEKNIGNITKFIAPAKFSTWRI